MKVYSVKEAYYTLQGEGAQMGRAALFLRFSGCNLWSGLERDRQNAVCNFCDTDFIGTDGPNGGKFSGDALIDHLIKLLPEDHHKYKAPLIVCTGGEPLLQLDMYLIEKLHDAGFEIAIETNGTVPLPDMPDDKTGIDWVCVSPKARAPLKIMKGDELKLVYPQTDNHPDDFKSLDFQHFFLQPLDGPDQDVNIKKTIEFCQQNPQWRLSLQTHKIIGIA